MSSSNLVLRVSLRTGGSLTASKTSLTVTFPSNVTVREVRDCIAHKIQLLPNDLCLVWQGRILKDDAKRLDEFKIPSNSQIIAVKKSRSVEHSKSLSCSYGTITCIGPSPVEVSQIVNSLTTSLSSPPTPETGVRWHQGLDTIRTLQGLSNSPKIAESDSVVELGFTVLTSSFAHFEGLAIRRTCSILEMARQDLYALAEHLCDNQKVEDMAIDVAPSCNKASAMLGVVGATLADLGAAKDVSFYSSSTANASISVHSVNLDKADIAAFTSVASFQLGREMKFSLVSSQKVMVRAILFWCGLNTQSCLHSHDHGVFIYNSQKLAMVMAIEIICDALAKGAAILIVRSPTQIEQTLQALSAMHFNSAALLNSKRLITVTNSSYTEQANSASQLKWGYDVCKSTLEQSGCSQLNVIGEVSYFSDVPSASAASTFHEQICHYENELTSTVHGTLPMVGVCFYDRNAFPAEVITSVERVHPVLLYEAN